MHIFPRSIPMLKSMVPFISSYIPKPKLQSYTPAPHLSRLPIFCFSIPFRSQTSYFLPYAPAPLFPFAACSSCFSDAQDGQDDVPWN